MRNVGRHYHFIEIQSVDSSERDRNGAIVPKYTTVLKAWAHKHIFRTGQGGEKRQVGMNEINMERLHFRITPSAEVKVQWDYVILYDNERYEISYIQDFKDELVISCYTAPISNTRKPTDGSTAN